MSTNLTFEEYREEWLKDILAGNPSTVELGRRFAHYTFITPIEKTIQTSYLTGFSRYSTIYKPIL